MGFVIAAGGRLAVGTAGLAVGAAGGRRWVAVVAQEEPMVGSEHFNSFYNCDNFQTQSFTLPLV